ncbi:hypothetical protein NRP93_000954 [Clostridium botulinum]|nr:hypothetical protein [Clostridium botulinum]
MFFAYPIYPYLLCDFPENQFLEYDSYRNETKSDKNIRGWNNAVGRYVHLYTGDHGIVFGKLIDIRQNKLIINALNFWPGGKGHYKQLEQFISQVIWGGYYPRWIQIQ